MGRSETAPLDRLRRGGAGAATLAVVVMLVGAFWLQRVWIDEPMLEGNVDSDVRRYFLPAGSFVHESLGRGELPLWNPYQLAGVPVVPLPSAALYPPNLLLYTLFEPPVALEVHLVLHLVVCGLGAWLFATRLGLGLAARSAAMLGFVLSGQILRWVYNPTALATACWLPFILWATHGLVTTARLRWAVGLALLTALAHLGGFAQAMLYGGALAVAYGAVGLCFWTPRDLRVRVLFGAALSAALFLGLVAVQLLPTLELLADASRDTTALDLRTATLGSTTPGQLLRGLLGQTRFDRAPLLLRWAHPEAVSFLTVPLVLLGLADRRRRGQWLFFALGAALAACFMMGSHTPVFPLFFSTPLGSLFRIPTRMAFVYAFALSMLVAMGVEGCRTLLKQRSPRAAWILTSVLTLALGIEVYSRSQIVFTRPILQTEPLEGWRTAVEELRRRAGYDRVFFPGDFEKIGTWAQVFSVPDYEPMLPGAYKRLFAPSQRLWHGRISPPRTHAAERLMDLMSVRWQVEARGLVDLTASGPIYQARPKPFRARGRPSALPRVYVVHEAVVEEQPGAARSRLLGLDFDPRRQVVVDRPVPDLAGQAAPGAETAEITHYSNSEVRISAHCLEPCLLVLTDLHYPGWRARVDGNEAEVRRANLLFRGVRLEAGSHRVRFDYEPHSFRAGAHVTLATLVSIVAGAGWSWRRGRRLQAHATARVDTRIAPG